MLGAGPFWLTVVVGRLRWANFGSAAPRECVHYFVQWPAPHVCVDCCVHGQGSGRQGELSVHVG